MMWYQNGDKHRDDGPAVIDPDGTRRWYFNGKLSNKNGPAIISADGKQE